MALSAGNVPQSGAWQSAVYIVIFEMGRVVVDDLLGGVAVSSGVCGCGVCKVLSLAM